MSEHKHYTFGAWCKNRRRALDLTQKELAAGVWCAVVTIRKIEASALRPSEQLAELMLQRLDVPSDEQGELVALARGKESARSNDLAYGSM